MKAQCVIIIGPESSGTRLVKSIFLLNGYAGSPEHAERWGNSVSDYAAPSPDEYPAIVWRFSYPMGGETPRPDYASLLAARNGYDVLFLICVRDGWCSSQHGNSDRKNLESYLRLFAHVVSVDFPARVISYEHLCAVGVGAFRDLPLILPITTAPPLVNGNDKYR